VLRTALARGKPPHKSPGLPTGSPPHNQSKAAKIAALQGTLRRTQGLEPVETASRVRQPPPHPISFKKKQNTPKPRHKEIQTMKNTETNTCRTGNRGSGHSRRKRSGDL
jgi:hypothetical protein